MFRLQSAAFFNPFKMLFYTFYKPASPLFLNKTGIRDDREIAAVHLETTLF